MQPFGFAGNLFIHTAPMEKVGDERHLTWEEIRELLAALPATVDTLLLVGAEAHICIYQTAVGALQAGYRPWIVADAVSSRKKRNLRLALARMQTLGMAVGPAEMAIYELLHKAGTEPFKAMLTHLK
jgi:hypothetical protein